MTNKGLNDRVKQVGENEQHTYEVSFYIEGGDGTTICLDGYELTAGEVRQLRERAEREFGRRVVDTTVAICVWRDTDYQLEMLDDTPLESPL